MLHDVENEVKYLDERNEKANPTYTNSEIFIPSNEMRKNVGRTAPFYQNIVETTRTRTSHAHTHRANLIELLFPVQRMKKTRTKYVRLREIRSLRIDNDEWNDRDGFRTPISSE